MPPLAIALTLAATGFPVFPCGAIKTPAIPKAKGGNGFKDASTDPRRIRELWALAGDAAQLVGVPTGEASGIDVLDVDPRHGGHWWTAANRDHLGETRTHATMSGGQHRLFIHRPGVRNSIGKLAAGIDVRGEGGYAVWPPSVGYRVIHEAEVAEWPPWLLWLVLKVTEPPARPEPTTYTAPAEITDNRIERFVRAALDAVAAAPDGQKHCRLRNSALQLGGVAVRAGLSNDTATAMLIEALPATVKSWDVARRTIAWGLAKGRDRPIVLPDRPYEWRRAS